MPNRAVGGTPRRRVGRVAGAAAILLATVSSACARSDEDRIRRRLEGLAQAVSIEDSATPMIRQALATHLTTYLTPDANVDIGAPFSPVVGRDGVRGGAAVVRVPAGGVRVEFDDVRVTVDASRPSSCRSWPGRPLAASCSRRGSSRWCSARSAANG